MHKLVGIAALFVAASAAAGEPTDGSVSRTLNLPGSGLDVRVHYAESSPGNETVAGEGSIGANLPGDGRLTVRVPASFGPVTTTLGDTQVSAGYPVVHEGDLLPKVSVVAELALATAPGSRGTRPGMKATATKQLHWGIVQNVHAETELRTEGTHLARSYRTAVGTQLRILKKTTASVDLFSVRPSGRSLLPRDDQAQIGICHEVTPNAKLRLGVGAGVTAGQSSLRSTVGVDLRF